MTLSKVLAFGESNAKVSGKRKVVVMDSEVEEEDGSDEEMASVIEA